MSVFQLTDRVSLLPLTQVRDAQVGRPWVESHAVVLHVHLRLPGPPHKVSHAGETGHPVPGSFPTLTQTTSCDL